MGVTGLNNNKKKGLDFLKWKVQQLLGNCILRRMKSLPNGAVDLAARIRYCELPENL